MKIYLSGGMRSGWQEKVKSAIYGFDYIDPCSHGLSKPDQYTLWDLEGIRQCDLVFAYLEKDNPSGYGLSLEIGYAKALGKRIIFIDEQPNNKYLDMVRSCADVATTDFRDGMDLLSALGEI